jgi:hypothetical protein
VKRADLLAWLTGRTLAVPVLFVRDELPDKPDAACAVTWGTGQLGRSEGHVDRRSFLLDMRGASNKLDQPEELLDELRTQIERDMAADLDLLWVVQFGPTLTVPGTLRTSRRPEAIATFSFEETR